MPGGPSHSNWKGGRVIDSRGYVRVYYKEYHSRKMNDRYVYEHVLVMEEHLGRRLVDKENVHHKNGIRDDNHIDNLELWSTSQPKGQRVLDKTRWAIEWLVDQCLLSGLDEEIEVLKLIQDKLMTEKLIEEGSANEF